jgi:hypothetical protein
VKRNIFARYAARRQFRAASAEAEQAWETFTATADGRREALLWAADCERTMAATAFGFADASHVDKDGFTREQWHDHAALLLTMVADTEVQPPARAWCSNLADDPAVADVLARMTAAGTLWERAHRTLRLYDLLVGRVGSQAAEALATVAYRYLVLAGVPAWDAIRWVWPTGRDGVTR